MSTERQLGDRWAAKLRAAGCFVQKIPASSIAGFPDWLVAGPDGIELVEAKRALRGKLAYNPRQLSGAQRWFLDQVAQRAYGAWVLILAEDGYVLLDYEAHGKRPLTSKRFNARKESYDAKS